MTYKRYGNVSEFGDHLGAGNKDSVTDNSTVNAIFTTYYNLNYVLTGSITCLRNDLFLFYIECKWFTMRPKFEVPIHVIYTS